jgi:hypothetical protein
LLFPKSMHAWTVLHFLSAFLEFYRKQTMFIAIFLASIFTFLDTNEQTLHLNIHVMKFSKVRLHKIYNFNTRSFERQEV